MRVALCVPETNYELLEHCPPYNLGYIAAYLRQQNPHVEVKIFDHSITDELFRFQPDIVGVTATTPQANSAYALLDSIRRNRPDILTVMGGVHASSCPEEALRHAHVVVVGEGEKALADIVANFDGTFSKYPLLVQGETVENLDDIPMAFDLLDMKAYIELGAKAGPQNLPAPAVSLMTSRGCPYRCPFCANSWRQTKVRYMSAERVTEEILFLHERYGVVSVWFNDDEFLINRARLKELAVLFEEKGIDKWLTWGCQARVQTVANEETLVLAKKMGCKAIFCGFESANERVLHYLKNGTTTRADNDRAIETIGKVGIPLFAGFIFGTPTETFKEMRETFNYVVKNPEIKGVGLVTLTPYPKTPLWTLCSQLGLLSENVNYDILLPSLNPKKAFKITTLDSNEYYRFVLDKERMGWIITQRRVRGKFWSLMRVKTFWYCWLHHPLIMLGLAGGSD